MEVAILTTAQSRNLHKRFDGHIEIQPTPLNNNTWFITRADALYLKEWMIDKVGVKPSIKDKAIQVWDFLKDLARYELDDYPQFRYNTSIDLRNATQEELDELAEYTARFADLNFENVT